MKKHVIALALTALACGTAFAQANDTLAKIKSKGEITLGVRDEKPFFHCHALWTEDGGRINGGHILPEETIVAEPFEVDAFGIDGATFLAEPDPETGFKLFGPVALTIVFALSASLILSLTVVPVLASFLLKRGDAHEPWLVRKMQAGYAPLLAFALARSKLMVTLASLSLVAAGGAYLVLGKAFMPTMDEGDIIMQLEKLPSISLAQTIATDLSVQQAVMKKVPEVKAIIARSGSDELGLDPMGLNQTDTFLVLKPREEWQLADKE